MNIKCLAHEYIDTDVEFEYGSLNEVKRNEFKNRIVEFILSNHIYFQEPPLRSWECMQLVSVINKISLLFPVLIREQLLTIGCELETHANIIALYAGDEEEQVFQRSVKLVTISSAMLASPERIRSLIYQGPVISYHYGQALITFLISNKVHHARVLIKKSQVLSQKMRGECLRILADQGHFRRVKQLLRKGDVEESVLQETRLAVFEILQGRLTYCLFRSPHEKIYAFLSEKLNTQPYPYASNIVVPMSV